MPTNRDSWPDAGPHRRLLQLLDELREAQRPRRSFMNIAAAAADADAVSHETVRSWLRGDTLPSTLQLGMLVAALGGGTDDRNAALTVLNQVQRKDLDLRTAAARKRSRRAEPRVVARPSDRTSLRPAVLPPIPRIAAVADGLKGSTRGSVTFLVGDGGLGKSVLIGQLLDRMEAEQDRTWGPASALLVSCAAVPGGLALAEPTTLDRAMASAADVEGSLLDRLRRMRDAFGSVGLLLDTLDVVLDDTTLPALANYLGAAADIGDVLVSCRSYEFGAYFADARRSAPALSGRIREVRVPELSGDEIVQWTRSYLGRAGPLDAARQRFLASMSAGVTRPSTLRTVCSVPVRLALTCEVFAQTGHAPMDLTVTELYRAYWKDRVSRHNGLANAAAARKEAAAHEVAGHVVSSSGRIALRVPKWSRP